MNTSAVFGRQEIRPAIARVSHVRGHTGAHDTDAGRAVDQAFDFRRR
jgi:hypothetical protein